MRGAPVVTGTSELIGQAGIVRETLGPDGLVFVRGELWQARTEGDAAAARARTVRVDGIDEGSCSESNAPDAPAPWHRISPVAALIAVAAVAVLLLIILSAAVRVAREYERGVIFRLGRLKSPPKGPGLFLLIPIIDKMVRVDLRTVTLNVPPQEVITKDNVPVRVNAVAYFRIIDPEKAIVQIENFMVATSQISQTTLRSVLGQHSLDELLSERDKINAILQQIIDEATSPWGIKVSIVEVKDVEIPAGMQRAMARQAEAERERRAKVIAAEGEFQASERLKDAAQVLSENPMSLQLRFLQTMLEISSERSSTIILPLPIELFRPLIESVARLRAAELTARASARPDLGPNRRHRAGAREAARARSAARSSRPAPTSSRVPVLTRAARTARRRRPSRSAPARREPDAPGWQVRVVPNLYPAFEHQEVIIHTPRHVRSLAELTDDELAPIATAWHSGARLRAPPASLRPYLLVNEGREAGASLPHSHSQLVWLREAPPEVAAELPSLQQGTARSAPCCETTALEIALGGELRLRAALGGPRPVRAADRAACARGRAAERTLASALALLRRAIRAPARARRTGPVQRLAPHGRALAPRDRAAGSPSSPGSSSAPAST